MFMATVTYLGHSGFLVDLDGKILLFDPWLDPRPRNAQRLVPPSTSAEKIRKADVIFISSPAFDHFDLHDVSIIAAGTYAHVIAPEEVLSRLDIQDKFKMAAVDGDSFEFYGMSISVLPVRNNVPGSVGYLVRAGGRSIYFSGDTYDFYALAEVEADLALLPIGGTQTMDILSAVSALKKMRVRHVIPCHYDTFSRIRADPYDFANRVKRETKAQAVVLAVGQTARF
jgi:L-ascorbate metabolism protein UlaG (beta-lactamase superfamily)